MSQTVNFKGKGATGSVHTCIYVTKSAGAMILILMYFFKICNKHIFLFILFYFFLRGNSLTVSANIILPALLHINHYFTLNKRSFERAKATEGRWEKLRKRMAE